ncbi:glycoside hydrolase family 39 protein [Zopfia rhizophila CBS 207.26]|uniref:Glycoside hydrolase family 39 protein n=1 Tax=Zopfia rhizophila CBS 207.26 TaxID=1314779 RepID=A0A6A6DJG7_9PEZI|nr:glycoside hydrolase family 39 protein [Zopfia rhizophila CBS 207.26]
MALFLIVPSLPHGKNAHKCIHRQSPGLALPVVHHPLWTTYGPPKHRCHRERPMVDVVIRGSISSGTSFSERELRTGGQSPETHRVHLNDFILKLTYIKQPVISIFVIFPHAFAHQVSIAVNASQTTSDFAPFNGFFGCDGLNYAYSYYSTQLPSQLGTIGPKQTYFRTHSLLTTGDHTPGSEMGSTNACTEDSNGNPIYNWTNNVMPYKVGFVPKVLSTHPYKYNFLGISPYNDIYTGWSYPPTSYEKCEGLVYNWAKHCLEKNGTVGESYKFHNYAITAIRRAIPTARIGGPDGDYLSTFLSHMVFGRNLATGQIGVHLAFIPFHAKDSPSLVNASETNDAHLRLGILAQLRNIDDAFAFISTYPELRSKPIVVDEMDPDGCAARIIPQYCCRNGIIYSSYTVASFAQALDLSVKHAVNPEGALTWAFEYDGHEYFNEKPVFNVHRMLRVVANGLRHATDAGVLSTCNPEDDRLSVFIWCYHDDDLPKPDAEINLRIDANHSNAYTTWLTMGSPQSPTNDQYTILKASGKLQVLHEPDVVEAKDGIVTVNFSLPIHATSFVVLEN